MKKKRDRVKRPGLKKNLNRKNIQEYLDFDYLDKLNDEELDFMNKMVLEHYTADFRCKKGEKNLVKSKKKKREIFRNNNSRNVDLYSRIKIINKLDGLDKVYDQKEEYEDMLHLKLDLMKQFTKK